MKHEKIMNLLNETNNSKFGKRKWNIVNDNEMQIMMQKIKLCIIQKC